MDADRFDEILQLLVAGPTRREALRVLVALGLAALLGERGIDAKGRKRKRKGKRKKKRTPRSRRGACPPCQTRNAKGQCVADPAQNRMTCAGSGLVTSICCNGVCCDGCCGADGSCGPCRVFVTSTDYRANLGGLAGADAKCQERAAAGGLPGWEVPGTYMAWLSDDTGSPATRFRRSAKPYRMTIGADIASSYADLVARPERDIPLNWTELGQQVLFGFVWTNTRTDGESGASESVQTCPPGYGFNRHCDNWTRRSGLGGVGEFSETDCRWTSRALGNCGDFHRLYCFQQR